MIERYNPSESLSVMDAGVTCRAKRNQVTEAVVPLRSRYCGTFTVNVVDLQLFGAATNTAFTAIPSDSSTSVKTECELMNSGDFILTLAWRASLLWARCVGETATAVAAYYRGSDRCSSSHLSHSLKMCDVFCGPVRWGARFADLLMTAGRFVFDTTNRTKPLSESATSLTMRFQRARFAALEGWGCLINDRTAIRARQHSVFSHDVVNSKLVMSQYSMGF